MTELTDKQWLGWGALVVVLLVLLAGWDAAYEKRHPYHPYQPWLDDPTTARQHYDYMQRKYDGKDAMTRINDRRIGRRCPVCKRGALELQTDTISEPIMPAFHVRGRHLPRRERLVTFAACNECEHCCEPRACTESPACARAGCADCERSYGPRRGSR